MSTSRIRQLLADLLLGSDARAHQAAAQFDTLSAWNEVIATAAEWRVIPQLMSQLDRLNHSISPASALRLKRQAMESWGRSAFLAAKGAGALAHLEAGGVRAATFKGLASIARLYRDATCRTIADVDVLVEDVDLDRAVSILEANGYRRHIDTDIRRYADFVSRSPAFAGSRSITLRGDSEGSIDLHWSIVKGLEPSGILDRVQRLPFRNQTIPVVSVEDSVLLTASHAARQNLNIGAACRDLIDLKISLGLVTSPSSRERLEQLAAAAGMQALLAAIVEILRSFDDEFPDVFRTMEERATGDLVALFHEQVVHGEINKDLLYLAHWSPGWQIFSGLATSPRMYRSFMRTFETEVSGQPISFWSRFRLLTGSLFKLRFGHLRSLRALARVKYD